MNKKGFTLIELLVVIAIIGLLSTLAVVALGSARTKARDSKRLSDLRQLQTALELYYTDRNSYPNPHNSTVLGGSSTACLNASGFGNTGCSSPYMGQVPSDPLDTQNYSYTSADGTTYSVTTTLEGTVDDLDGEVVASPAGIKEAP